MKVIIDFIPNHTADKHTWFEQSCRREGVYADFYVWSDGKVDESGQRVAPNNWVGHFEIIHIRNPYGLHFPM